VRIPYLPVALLRPIPSLGSRLFHYRPVTYVRVTGPHGDRVWDGLLDTGADATVFHESAATRVGIDLTGAEERHIELVGRPAPIRVRYASVQLQITDGLRETYDWTAVVGFTTSSLQYNLLGHGGFLEYFDAEFRGADHEVVLIPNASFPGIHVAMAARP
jgi:hypothetical protein